MGEERFTRRNHRFTRSNESLNRLRSFNGPSAETRCAVFAVLMSQMVPVLRIPCQYVGVYIIRVLVYYIRAPNIPRDNVKPT